MDDIVRNTTRVLEKYERQVLFAYLFGSSARGESTSSSDVDIAVFLPAGPGKHISRQGLHSMPTYAGRSREMTLTWLF